MFITVTQIGVCLLTQHPHPPYFAAENPTSDILTKEPITRTFAVKSIVCVQPHSKGAILTLFPNTPIIISEAYSALVAELALKKDAVLVSAESQPPA